MGSTGLYALTDEHEAIREAVREIAEREIAPHAADVDANSRFPIEAQKALTAAGFQATHIPEAYGGEGADAIATCIVIEEVARVDVSASLIPAVNKLGSMPIILSGPRGAEAAGAARRSPRGEAMISYGAVRARGRLRRRGHADPRPPRRRHLGAQRHQGLDHQRGRLRAGTRSWR